MHVYIYVHVRQSCRYIYTENARGETYQELRASTCPASNKRTRLWAVNHPVYPASPKKRIRIYSSRQPTPEKHIVSLAILFYQKCKKHTAATSSSSSLLSCRCCERCHGKPPTPNSKIPLPHSEQNSLCSTVPDPLSAS